MKLLLTFLLLTILLTACTIAPALTPTTQIIPPISEPTLPITPPTPPPKPPYLLSILPEGMKTKELYDKSLSNMTMGRGVVVEIIDRGDLGITEELREMGSQSLRVALYVNNQQIDQGLLTIADGLMPEGPFWLSWTPILEPGLHEVRFEIITHLGEMMEYSWQFIIEE
jgi:hypothetical protein